MRLRLSTDLVGAYLLGAAEALLLARLVLRLMAARPDNDVVRAIVAITDPLIGTLAVLDAGQPRFGATLELSTLALCALVPLIGAAAGLARRRISAPR